MLSLKDYSYISEKKCCSHNFTLLEYETFFFMSISAINV